MAAEVQSSITEAELKHLRDPRRALRACGMIPTQAAVDGRNLVPYNPDEITVRMQRDILSYIADPPRDPHTGMTRWMLLIGYRQGGKSVTAEYGFYVRTAYAQSWQHLCTADNGDRAGELLKRVNGLHKTWPRRLRAERAYDAEVWQATFREMRAGGEHLVERVMRTQHAGQNPIGLPWDSVHWSEFCFSQEAPGYWSGLRPAIVNRAHALMLWESTPNPGNLVPDCGFGKEMYFAAKTRHAEEDGAPSRFFSKFYPFWDGKLNRRPWLQEWKPDNSELRLLEKYGPYGLRLEHLAFRREAMRTDPEIRRNPDVFGIWYPFDDLTCWAKVSGAIFQSHHLDRQANSGRLKAWPNGETECFYPGWRKDPGEVDPNAAYIIAVDPNGYGGRDHGAAELREVWSDEQYEVASFAGGRIDGVDPEVLGHWVGKTARRYKAEVVVESTGVGTGVLTLLRQQYPDVRLYHHNGDPEKPGVPASPKTKQEALAHHKDALMDDLWLQDRAKYEQHISYRNDKAVEETDGQLQLQGGTTSRQRRPRHHWDRVSASMWASWAVANGICRRPVKPKPVAPPRPPCETIEGLEAVMARIEQRRTRGVLQPEDKP